MTRVYITKFALTKGIFPVEAAIIGDRAVVQGAYPWQKQSFYKGDWHTDPDRALDKASAMAAAKANHHRNEARRLQELSFSIQEEAL